MSAYTQKKVDFGIIAGQTWVQNFLFFQDSRIAAKQSYDPGGWQPGLNYLPGDLSRGSDNAWYVCVKANIGINPVGDATASWSAATVVDFSGSTLEFDAGALALTAGSGLTVTAGQIVVTLTAAQTAGKSAAQHYSLKWTDASGNVSFPLGGNLNFTAP